MDNQKLKEARLKMGLTQEEMAKLLNETKLGTYRSWEQGVNPVPNLMGLALIGMKRKTVKRRL